MSLKGVEHVYFPDTLVGAGLPPRTHRAAARCSMASVAAGAKSHLVEIWKARANPLFMYEAGLPLLAFRERFVGQGFEVGRPLCSACLRAKARSAAGIRRATTGAGGFRDASIRRPGSSLVRIFAPPALTAARSCLPCTLRLLYHHTASSASVPKAGTMRLVCSSVRSRKASRRALCLCESSMAQTISGLCS
jgi:hypothetical protein